MIVGLIIKKALIDRIVAATIKRRGGEEHDVKVTNKVLSYLVYVILLVIVLGILGVPLTALGTLVGLLGAGLAFALKDLIANFVSGIFILITRPFKIGDQIEANGEKGIIKDIKIRATEIRTFDGKKAIIPNSHLYTQKVINTTAYNKRRFEAIVGISYEDDIKKAKELAMEVLKESEQVEEEPNPQVLVDELAGSSINLKLRGWTKSQQSSQTSTTSEITQKIKEKYVEEGIEIPFPIRTVYMEQD